MRAFIATTALTAQLSAAAVLSRDVNLSGFSSGSRSIGFLADNTGDLIFRAQGVCTDDDPTSFCGYSISIRGREGVEFFVSDATGRANALSPGTLVEASTSGGVWQTALLNSVTVSYSGNLLAPETSGYSEEYQNLSNALIGFRIRDDDDNFNYGWIDLSLGTPPQNPDGENSDRLLRFPRARTAFLQSTLNEPARITLIPEPSAALLLTLALLPLIRRLR